MLNGNELITGGVNQQDWRWWQRRRSQFFLRFSGEIPAFEVEIGAGDHIEAETQTEDDGAEGNCPPSDGRNQVLESTKRYVEMLLRLSSCMAEVIADDALHDVIRARVRAVGDDSGDLGMRRHEQGHSRAHRETVNDDATW